MKIANRCAGIEAEQMEPPIKRLQLRMGVANRAFGLEPALESVDVLVAQMLGPIDLGCGLVEELEKALQSIDVLPHCRADHRRRELPQCRADRERQSARAQLNEIDESRAAVRGVD